MSVLNPADWKTQADELLSALPDRARKPIQDAFNHALQSILQDEQPNERFKIHTAAEALQPQPPIKWIVDQLFSSGSVSLMVGEAKSKKTYSIVDCGVAVACGETWLNRKTTQGPVLIIDEESGTRRMNRRLGDILRGHNAGPDTPIHYVSLAGVNLLELADQLVIENLIQQTSARLVIIDALIDVLGGADENAASEVQAAFHALRTISENTQAAMVVIHHNGKNGIYRGSSAMKGAVDLLLTVKSQPNSPIIDFNAETPRDTEPFSFSAVANFGEGTFNLSPTMPSATTPHYSKAQAFILRYLEANGQSDIAVMCSKADTCSADAARKAVYSLAAINKVKRIDGGGPGVKAVYSLANGSP